MSSQPVDDVPERTGSSTDRVTEEIRSRIVSGVYPPESRLRERDLSETLNVSRIPVREALARLQAAGFVTVSPRRGATVRRLTLQDVEELFDLRLSLEVFAARRAAEVAAGGGDTSGLLAAMAAAADATHRGDAELIPQANAALHAEIVTMTGNRMLQEAIRSSLGLMEWLFALTSDRGPDVQCAEHEGIVTAVTAGNAELAAALMFSHIELGRAPSLASLADKLPAT